MHLFGSYTVEFSPPPAAVKFSECTQATSLFSCVLDHEVQAASTLGGLVLFWLSYFTLGFSVSVPS